MVFNWSTNTKYIPAAGSANINDSKSLKRKPEINLVIEKALVIKKQKVIKSAAKKNNSAKIILDA